MALPEVSKNFKSMRNSKNMATASLNPISPKLTGQHSSSTEITNEQIQQVKLKNDENIDDLTCAICSELFIKSTTLNCSHTFCKYCIDRWRSSQRDCPICRTKIVNQVPTLVLDKIIETFLENSPEEIQKHRQQVIKERTEDINGNDHKTDVEENYTWNSFIEALSCAEDNNDWQDDEEMLNGDWSDDDYDVYAEYDYNMY